MKRIFKFGLLLLMFCVFSGCSKNEETPVYGYAEIIFSDKQKPDNAGIYTEAGNRIYSLRATFGKAGCGLNTGNYRIQPAAGQKGYTECYFQIIAGRTTKIIYSGYSAEVQQR